MISSKPAIKASEHSQVTKLGEIYAPERRATFLRGVLLIYDMTDEVMATTQLEGITNRDVQVELATPFVTQMRYLAMIMPTFYSAVCFDGYPITDELQETYDDVLYNFEKTVDDFLDGAESKLLGPIRIEEEIDPVHVTVMAVNSVVPAINVLPIVVDS